MKTQINRNKIEKVNKAIAIFMDCKFITDGNIMQRTTKDWDFPDPDNGLLCKVENLKYHYSWSWLMPVVQKISEVRFHTRFHLSAFPINISISGGGGAHIAINQGNCAGEEYKGERLIADTLNTNYMINDEKFQYTSIELVWIAVGQFVEWYNKNKESIVWKILKNT